MRLLSLLLTLGIASYGGYFALKQKPELKDQVLSYISTTSAEVLEARYTPSQLVEKADSILTYRPLLLMDVKYLSPNGKSTVEGQMLWDMVDGELILDTKSWKRTHGYGDCITMQASPSDFQLISLLSKKRLDRETIIQSLGQQPAVIDMWIDGATRKKLIVQSGTTYRLHFDSPHLAVSPTTKPSLPLYTKSAQIPSKTKKRYASSQIKRTSEAAFGSDFTVRHMKEIYLPVYEFTKTSSDGTQSTLFYSAFTGKPL